jgi:hypothetical protein
MEQSIPIEYNAIQRLQLKIWKLIEYKLRKLRTSGVPWSPKIQQFRTEIELWSMILGKRKGIKVSNTQIRRFMRKAGIWDAFSADKDGVEIMLNKAHQQYRVAKKNATDSLAR